jgi:hypothetical protein
MVAGPFLSCELFPAKDNCVRGAGIVLRSHEIGRESHDGTGEIMNFRNLLLSVFGLVLLAGSAMPAHAEYRHHRRHHYHHYYHHYYRR